MKAAHFSKLERIVWTVTIFLMMYCLATAKEKIPPTKSIRGHVMDARNRSIVGAKVFIRNVKKKTTTVLITDESGLYSIYGLDPKVDYEVHAEHNGMASEKMSVSSFLNRFDNVFNFQLKPGKSGKARSASEPEVTQVDLQAADGVRLSGDWITPLKAQETAFPTVMLLHEANEDSRMWEDFVQEHLLPAGFAVLNLDLRGHGRSVEKSLTKTSVEMTDPKLFPQDVAGAIRWLKSREEVDPNRISVIGSGLGADLAYYASGKHEEVRSAVALSANVENARRMSAGIENFQPHAILYVACDGDKAGMASAGELEKMTGFPVRAQIYDNCGARGKQLIQDMSEVSTVIMDWLKKN